LSTGFVQTRLATRPQQRVGRTPSCFVDGNDEAERAIQQAFRALAGASLMIVHEPHDIAAELQPPTTPNLNGAKLDGAALEGTCWFGEPRILGVQPGAGKSALQSVIERELRRSAVFSPSSVTTGVPSTQGTGHRGPTTNALRSIPIAIPRSVQRS
jgi:hypothetical protein